MFSLRWIAVILHAKNRTWHRANQLCNKFLSRYYSAIHVLAYRQTTTTTTTDDRQTDRQTSHRTKGSVLTVGQKPKIIKTFFARLRVRLCAF